ncbi:plasma-membrane calcium-translocating P-type ATPase [Carnobacterium iners]|uniref:P-type Ca(2+) transporter n=1 Tax=Carnobacterium iners TaxID=1073423 RepID=A0A1X7N2Q7_9LACT|nr:cation-translocating P-type ATPase [Carnobacterium iners]SEL19190.1 plasma-membrane calcium-translocating P-type ATPase [Carnobacterium iners]SMH31552.1 plasma-membrane calcium-translocating P-type ATPase [Carnobacterium iners]
MKDYQKEQKDILAELNTTTNGLKDEEVNSRLKKFGTNELKSVKKDSVLKLFLETFKDAMVIVLLIVAVVQILIGSVVESLIIFAVLMINSVVSVVQTKKAEGSLDALKNMSAPIAKVIRNGEKISLAANQLVPGDIVILDAGDYVPADGRLIEAGSLKIDEGMLTGESVPADKDIATLSNVVPVGDRSNMVHSGTLVVYGRGVFVITATGNQTEIGQVANLLESAMTKQTPLQKKLDQFSKQLGIGILILSILIFVIEAVRIYFGGTANLSVDLLNAFMFAVAVAVAAIPEALQSIVTIVLSMGTNKMAKRHAIIRKLPAVETLGATSVICTDKTGTLTQNKMTIVDYFLLNGQSAPFNDKPETWTFDEKRLMQIAVLANDSTISETGQELGDPTEVAMVSFSNKVNQPYDEIRTKHPRIAELPFDSDRKLMSTVHKIDDESMMLTKGGPDVIFDRSTKVLIDGEIVPLTDERLKIIEDKNEAFSDRALRVLAFAYKPIADEQTIQFEDENDLILVGIMAMIDPPREAVYGAVEQAKKAGIKTVMITGDHKTTAQAIARDIGISQEGDIALTGQELDALTEDELNEQLEKISVYARVSPENKIRIVRAWQTKDKVSAMTGDGVNDAPALKQADIGIAMGSGTDVAKDAAAMVLTDDNFVSIISAVEVGRNVYDNIKKAIAYLFAGNLGAIIAIVAALLMDWVNPFTALQLLFINLVNDSVPAIALGMEKGEPNVMLRKPRDPNEGIFAGETLVSVLYRGSLIGIAVIISQYIGLGYSNEISVAMAFTTLILARTLQTFPARSNSQTSIGAGLFSNIYVILAVIFCFSLYGLTVLPGVREFFAIPADFGWVHWRIAAGLAFGSVVLMEITKLIVRKKA